MLHKLYWEKEQLRKQVDSQQENLFNHLTAAYFAFNAAVTAWHLTDWIWEAATPDWRREIAQDLDLPKLELKIFQNKLVEKCRACVS